LALSVLRYPQGQYDLLVARTRSWYLRAGRSAFDNWQEAKEAPCKAIQSKSSRSKKLLSKSSRSKKLLSKSSSCSRLTNFANKH